MITELLLNLAYGVGVIATVAVAVFLLICVCSCWDDPEGDAPRWMKVIGFFVIVLPVLTLLGYCVRMPG